MRNGEEMNHTLITHLTSTNRGERKPALECLMECCANLPRGMGPSIGIATEDGNGYQLESLSNDMIVPQQQAILVPGSWGQEDDTGTANKRLRQVLWVRRGVVQARSDQAAQ